MLRQTITGVFILAGCLICFSFARNEKLSNGLVIGQPIDSLHGVIVYYNGPMDNVTDRNMTADNYNLGLKYQCVEFANRYYYEHYKHKMPESYGNAKNFFDKTIADGNRNTQRDLIQYTNPSQKLPKVGDLLVYDGTLENPYGHIAIIAKVTDHDIEVIQQNPGPGVSTRDYFPLFRSEGKWMVQDPRIMGWLRKE